MGDCPSYSCSISRQIPAVSLTSHKHQQENVGHYLTLDSNKLRDPCAKSKVITEELAFFGKYLLLTLGRTVCERHKKKITKYLAS